MNDALMKQLHDLDLTRILPGTLAVVGIVVALILARKILRVMLRLGRKRVAGGWASCDPEMDQLFQLASSSGRLTHEDADDDDDYNEARGCYILKLRGRRRERAQALMSTIHSSHNGWRYAPDDAEGQSVLSGPLFSIKV